MHFHEQLKKYVPANEQEARDRELMLSWLELGEIVYTRKCLSAHMTASGWVTNRDHSKILMAYHRIYDSWAWLGGHADGDQNLLYVAMKEAKEEAGLAHVRAVSEELFSVEVLTVSGHRKNGIYVPSHLHLNATYLLEADESEAIHEKSDENKGVKWFPLDECTAASSEPWMNEWIYQKLLDKMSSFEYQQKIE